ncbi:hypothetical protein JTE90_016256 [Oedothorax gibbosus]|uniref:Uncharacterized protein n=1 Tax=Oedothorax gibbosus TaxID=931172 RepID=A0AAV6VTT1_9ARAC|nr:hypothetical protein JTE90_016256 [Oedothorax gibbosus]
MPARIEQMFIFNVFDAHLWEPSAGGCGWTEQLGSGLISRALDIGPYPIHMHDSVYGAQGTLEGPDAAASCRDLEWILPWRRWPLL